VTAQMVENFLRGGAAVNVLARQARARVVVADFGVANPIPGSPELVSCPMAPGTANMAGGPAMTREHAVRAIEPGAGLAERGVDVLAGVGGFEIAGLVGVILVGAARRVPVVLDGFIAGAAALAAVTLAPDARHALFASHRSAEPGHAVILERLGLTPYLDLEMRLGEGAGAALFTHLARAAALSGSGLAPFQP